MIRPTGRFFMYIRYAFFLYGPAGPSRAQGALVYVFCRFGFDMFLFFILSSPFWFANFFARLFPFILTTFVACQCLPAIDVVYISSLPHLYVTDTAFLIFMALCKLATCRFRGATAWMDLGS